MAEPQYQRYHDLPKATLPPMANQIYLEDPKMLGIRLARYKFVAKMLAGKKHIAEIGCGDGFFSRVVAHEVGGIDLYDLDAGMGEKVMELDITKRPLPGAYQAIYSLDCFEHINLLDWDKALENVCASLDRDGVFILGMPSFDSQKYASEASKAGHVACMCDEQLRVVLEGHFKQVFTFGMNDEMLHVGFAPMRHYLLALCCGVKDVG